MKNQQDETNPAVLLGRLRWAGKTMEEKKAHAKMLAEARRRAREKKEGNK